VYLLPMTQSFRLTLAGCLVAIQAFAVHEADIRHSWGLIQWRAAPFFQIDVPQDMVTEPRTYVTIASISYSLISPLFHKESRWINISNAPSDADQSMEGQRVHALLGSDSRLTLIAPTVPGSITAQGLPTSEIVRAINNLLVDHHLTVSQPDACRFLRARGMVSWGLGDSAPVDSEKLDKAGFWACPLQYPVAVSSAPPQIAQSRYDPVFRKVESLCPRFFPPRVGGTKVIQGGERRHYSDSDMRLYVLDDGHVYYKYFRAYNLQMIGTIDDLMSGKTTLDCGKIRGRSGLPWEREI